MSTLKDVAALAGVSKATASLALNNGRVNAETRKRVVLCAQQLRYVPNRIGRTLTTGRSQVVEFLIMTSGRYADTVRHTALFYYLLEGVLSVVDPPHVRARVAVPDSSRHLRGRPKSRSGKGSLAGVAVLLSFQRSAVSFQLTI